MAAQIHDRASNWRWSPVLQPTCPPRFRHLCELVERLSRIRWRRSISGSNARPDLRRSGRVMVLISSPFSRNNVSWVSLRCLLEPAPLNCQSVEATRNSYKTNLRTQPATHNVTDYGVAIAVENLPQLRDKHPALSTGITTSSSRTSWNLSSIADSCDLQNPPVSFGQGAGVRRIRPGVSSSS